MTLKVEVCIEHPWTMRTAKSLDSSMNFDMFIEICSLSKAESTVREWASIRSLICVNPQMVKEIVPFSEMLSTVIMVTLQNFDISFGLRILKGKDSEFLGCRNMLFDLNCP